jgi:hypothetical protein
VGTGDLDLCGCGSLLPPGARGPCGPCRDVETAHLFAPAVDYPIRVDLTGGGTAHLTRRDARALTAAGFAVRDGPHALLLTRRDLALGALVLRALGLRRWRATEVRARLAARVARRRARGAPRAPLAPIGSVLGSWDTRDRRGA